jgi:NAD+ kinase
MKALLVYMKPKNKLQEEHFAKVKKVLKENNIFFKTKNREYLKGLVCKGFDIIFVLGGDGTFLRTSHHVKDSTPMFGINLDTRYKEGFLLQTTVQDFENDIKKIIEKKYKIIKINRLQAKLNGKIIPHLALNEFYIGFKNAYFTARYEFTIDGKTEFQKSSGILVGSGAGSNGWLKSAGGKVFPIDSDKFQMIVREPYCSRRTGCSIRHKIFDKNEKLKIKSEMKHGIIVADSLRPEYDFNKGHVLEISISKKHLNYLKILR